MIRPLTEELQKKTESELNEVPNRIEEDLNQLKEWIAKQPHLCVRTGDQWLIGFLRGCKFSLQRAKEKIDYFYTMRTLLPELFANRDPFNSDIQEALKAGIVFPLPKTANPADPRIVMYRWQYCNSDTMTALQFAKMYFLTMDILMNEDDNCIISGICLWADFKGFPLNCMLQLTPALLKKMVTCVQGAYPIRINRIYCMNAPPFFETIFNLAKSLMTGKLQKRMVFCSESDFDRIYEDIPQTIMPKENGGNAGSIEELAAAWKTKVESYREWFAEEVKYRSEEKLRLGNPKTTADLFGVEGSFRKLAID